MASKKSGNRFGDTIKSFLWFVIIAGAVVAFFRLNDGITLTNFVPYLRNRSEAVGRFYKECNANGWKDCSSLSYHIGQVNRENPYSGSENEIHHTSPDGSTTGTTVNPNSTNHSTSNNEDSSNSLDGQNSVNLPLTEAQILQEKLNSLNVVESYDTNIKYKRTEWKHWINIEGSSCWTVREEALLQQAEPDSVILLDKNDNITKEKSKACSILKGKWIDPYTGTTITDPTKTDVDHTSALAATARAGGQSWDKQKKEDFANDLDHLIVTSQKANRGKSDKTPSEWMPEKKDSWCVYSRTYVNILSKYNLNITQADKDVLNNVLSNCNF